MSSNPILRKCYLYDYDTMYSYCPNEVISILW